MSFVLIATTVVLYSGQQVVCCFSFVLLKLQSATQVWLSRDTMASSSQVPPWNLFLLHFDGFSYFIGLHAFDGTCYSIANIPFCFFKLCYFLLCENFVTWITIGIDRRHLAYELHHTNCLVVCHGHR